MKFTGEYHSGKIKCYYHAKITCLFLKKIICFDIKTQSEEKNEGS